MNYRNTWIVEMWQFPWNVLWKQESCLVFSSFPHSAGRCSTRTLQLCLDVFFSFFLFFCHLPVWPHQRRKSAVIQQISDSPQRAALMTIDWCWHWIGHESLAAGGGGTACLVFVHFCHAVADVCVIVSVYVVCMSVPLCCWPFIVSPWKPKKAIFTVYLSK